MKSAVGTLGGIWLSGSEFRRQKPLLLLCYLSLEGAQERRYLSELFWCGAADPQASLRSALKQLRLAAPECIQGEGQKLRALVQCDAQQLLQAFGRGEMSRAVELYDGPFLDGIRMRGLGPELEEWIFSRRELLARCARRALLQLGEDAVARGDAVQAWAYAERALQLRGCPELEPVELERFYRLLEPSGSPAVLQLQRLAAEAGVDLAARKVGAEGSLNKTEGETEEVELSTARGKSKSLLPGFLHPRSLRLGLFAVVPLVVTVLLLLPPAKTALPEPDPQWRADGSAAIAFPSEPVREVEVRAVRGEVERLLEVTAESPLELVTAKVWPMPAREVDGWAEVAGWDAYQVPDGPTKECPNWPGSFEATSIRFDIRNDYGDIAIAYGEDRRRLFPPMIVPLVGSRSINDLDVFFNASGIGGRGRLNDSLQLFLVPHPSAGKITIAEHPRLNGVRCTLVLGEEAEAKPAGAVAGNR